MPSSGSGSQGEKQRAPETGGEEPAADGLSARRPPEDEDDQRTEREIPDVTLKVPGLSLEELALRVEDLQARVSLQAELADAVKINVGIDAHLEGVDLELKGLEAQALLTANLENVRDILTTTLETLDGNPQLIEKLFRTASESGGLEGVAGSVGGTNEGSREGGEAAEREDVEKAREKSDTGTETTPAARKLAEDLGVGLEKVEGTGSGGRIIVRDVKKAARRLVTE